MSQSYYPSMTASTTEGTIEPRVASISKIAMLSVLGLHFLNPQTALYSNGFGHSLNQNRTRGTESQPISLSVVDADLCFELYRVFNELSHSQRALDAEFRKTLYENLWDLYT